MTPPVAVWGLGWLSEAEWTEVPSAQFGHLQSLFTAPRKPAEDKWFTTEDSAASLLLTKPAATDEPHSSEDHSVGPSWTLGVFRIECRRKRI